MKTSSIVTLLFALLLFVGGIMGYLKAGSMASVIASSILGILFLSCAYYQRKGSCCALTCTLALTFFVLCFFIYRFSLSYAFMPAGLMVLLSALFASYLVYVNKSLKCPH